MSAVETMAVLIDGHKANISVADFDKSKHKLPGAKKAAAKKKPAKK